jgi:hypothetical protein
LSDQTPYVDDSHAAYLDAAFGAASEWDYPAHFDPETVEADVFSTPIAPESGEAKERVTIATLEALPCWVAWQKETREGSDKPTKLPYCTARRKAKANDPRTWLTRKAAEAVEKQLPKPYGIGGVGLEFTQLDDGRGVAGIDLDSCRDPETGRIQPWAQELIDGFASYTEVSPSKTGVKVFYLYGLKDLSTIQAAIGFNVKGTPKHSLLWARSTGEDHPEAIELHISNRYFAVTDDILPGCTDELREVETDRILQLIQVDGPAFGAAGEGDDEADAAIAAQESGPKPSRKGITGNDRSRSALAFRVGAKAKRDGATFEEMCKAIEEDATTAGWFKDKGKANGGRELQRIWEKAKAAGPVIRIVAGELHKTADQAEAALLTSKLPIFQRGSGLVRPVVQDVPAARGRMTVSAALHGIDSIGLQDTLCSVTGWERFDARAEDWVRVNAPKNVADVLLSRVGLWKFPKVVGVVTTPTIRPDGSILSSPGYDEATRLYHAADPDVTLSEAVHQPTRAIAEQALALLNDLLAEFPFVTASEDQPRNKTVSHAVALSALVTPVVRGALSVAPLHAFRATTAGTGKSFLVDLASAISSGRPCPVAAAGADEAETEKRLAGLLLAGFPLATLDNVNGELGGDLLCQAIERPFIRLRPLGRSDIVEIESRATLFATGNGLRVRGDMVRRSLVSDLDAGMERPELRKFEGDPVAVVMANRGRYVSACLAIVRAYILAGRPDVLTPIASFGDWSDTVRSALVWLGCADPADSMEQAREDDPELAELREVTSLWRDTLGIGGGFTVKDLADRADERTKTQMGEPTEHAHPELRDCLLRIAGERGAISTKRLGYWLRGREGRIVNGFRLAKAGVAHGGAISWCLKVGGR